MPEICRFYGIMISMFAKDHNPPHIHIKYGDYYITISIEKEIIKGEIPNPVLQKALKWLSIHREELMKNWILLQQSNEAEKIEPLM